MTVLKVLYLLISPGKGTLINAYIIFVPQNFFFFRNSLQHKQHILFITDTAVKPVLSKTISTYKLRELYTARFIKFIVYSLIAFPKI